MRINTNINSLTAQESSSQINRNLSSSLEKLSSGLRINKAADDASGMAIADKLRTQASSLGQSISNANSGSALIQIADKAMGEQSNILDTVKTKLIQASTDTTSTEGREAIRKDISKLLNQMDNIAAQTNYNGINLLNTKSQDFNFQIGEKSSYDIDVSTAYAANTSGLGGGANAYTAAQTIDPAGGMNVGISSTAVAAEHIVNIKQTGLLTTGDRSVDVSANNVLKMSLSGTTTADAVTFTTTDQTTRDMLVANAAGNDSLAYNSSTETFTFTSTATDAASDITFSAPVDIGTLSISGLKAGTLGETLSFSNTTALTSIGAGLGTVTIQNKLTDADGALTDTVTVSSTQVDGLTGGDLLSKLTSLAENGLTKSVANGMMAAVDEAINQLNTVRSDFGSTQNQLESSIRNMATTQTNIKAAESVIRDVDYAAESANFNKQNIIAQAGTYAMSQANSIQQNVMRLLQ